MTDWITTPVTPDMLRGAIEVERTERGVRPHRLPAWVRRQYPDEALMRTEAHTSGVRLCLRTRATVIELETVPTRTVYQGAPPPPEGVYELLVDGRGSGRGGVAGGDVTTVDMMAQTGVTTRGRSGSVRFSGLPEREKEVAVWLPHREATELIALRTDAPVLPAENRERRVWLHHGSSISHGSNAEAPTAIWPAIAAERGGVDLVNLGFGGNALLDPFTARTIRDAPADLISLKIGINLTNTDLMRRRAFVPAVHGFLDTIREGHPDTPLLVVSPILCPIQEDTPGPVTLDPEDAAPSFRATGDPAERAAGKLTLNVIRDELARVVERRAADDPHLHHLDGRVLYGESDHDELPLPDRLHPDTAGHRRIGERFADAVFASGGAFAARG
ncbi:GDSL-type esterase/lipase family protein [Nocardiopsis lucentensis]|uniref:GDSL-type esterase/lipase family protein n=1 Tax=Nocardiopsis lucentensis TaxID=53441 RepID=UPI00037C6782|nr:GDSL-type esterase/lipase family protein [Nocardiopsis lucentensis]